MRKKLLTITGPSGSGKTELLELLCAKPEFAKVRTSTTRPPRFGEDAKSYHFVTETEFLTMREQGELLESVMFNGCCYGTSLGALQDTLLLGKIPVIVVDPQGVHSIRRACEPIDVEVKSCYVTADLDVLIHRYMQRVVNSVVGREMASYHSKRLYSIIEEHSTWSELAKYDFTLYNTGSLQHLEEYAVFLSTNLLKGD